jgi:hypothetical protein
MVAIVVAAQQTIGIRVKPAVRQHFPLTVSAGPIFSGLHLVPPLDDTGIQNHPAPVAAVVV